MPFENDAVKVAQKQLTDVDKVIQGSLEEAAMIPAQLIAQDAQARAPKRSGKLARSIEAKKGKSTANQGQAMVVVGFPGRFQEFGVKHHPPQPFFRPAADAQSKPGLRQIEIFLQGKVNQVT